MHAYPLAAEYFDKAVAANESAIIESSRLTKSQKSNLDRQQLANAKTAELRKHIPHAAGHFIGIEVLNFPTDMTQTSKKRLRFILNRKISIGLYAQPDIVPTRLVSYTSDKGIQVYALVGPLDTIISLKKEVLRG